MTSSLGFSEDFLSYWIWGGGQPPDALTEWNCSAMGFIQHGTLKSADSRELTLPVLPFRLRTRVTFTLRDRRKQYNEKRFMPHQT